MLLRKKGNGTWRGRLPRGPSYGNLLVSNTSLLEFHLPFFKVEGTCSKSVYLYLKAPKQHHIYNVVFTLNFLEFCNRTVTWYHRRAPISFLLLFMLAIQWVTIVNRELVYMFTRPHFFSENTKRAGDQTAQPGRELPGWLPRGQDVSSRLQA